MEGVSLENMRKIKILSILVSLMAGSCVFPPASLAPMQELQILGNNSPIDGQSQPTFSNTSAAFPTVNQEIVKPQDQAKFQKIMQDAVKQQLYRRSLPQIMQNIAQKFIGTPYQANLLDSSSVEKLVVTLNKFDCVLFVETVLAIARGVAEQNYSYPTFTAHLSDERYRDGKLNGYCSRLHYFSEWIADNQKRGIVRDIARHLGGVPLHKKQNFMSQHKRSYPQLMSNNDNYQCMVAAENRLNALEINYIPTSKIHSVYEKLQPGDIVGVATSIDGLDVTHTGLVYRMKNGNVGFIHASPGGAVKITPDLQAYVERINRSIGILLARPVDSR